MLLTDGNPNTTEDLRAYESSILGVASTEAIDLDVKLRLATEEIAQDVLEFLLRRGTGVSDVVVTRQMKRWHALHTLAVVYRDAFHNQLNDRYKEKFHEYRKLAGLAKGQTMQFGVGLVARPVPVAKAPSFGFETGPFESMTYYARVAWVSASGQEGLPSAVTTYDAPAGSVPVVTAVNAPVGAVGYHVYLGTTESSLRRQTGSPVAVGDSFTLSLSGLVDGVAPGDGQVPDSYVSGSRMMVRG